MTSSTTYRARNTDPRSYEEARGEIDRTLYKHTLLTAAQEKNLAKRIERGDHDAKMELIEKNMRLVRSLAFPYARTCSFLDIDDITAIGVIGLTRAAEKFDYRKGFKFSTYATWWIKQSISRGIANEEETIRAPVHIQEQYRALRRAYAKFVQDTEHEPTDVELSEASGISLDLVHTWQISRPGRSLNAGVGEEGDTEFLDLLADPDADTYEESASELQKQEVAHLLADLPEEERNVVFARFFDNKGLRTVAKEMGLPVTEVRKLEHQASSKLRELYGAN